MATAGAIIGLAVAGVRDRERRDDGQDAAGLPRTCGPECSGTDAADLAEHAPLRKEPRRGRHPRPPQPQGQPPAHPHPAQARGRAGRHGPHRRPGPADLPGRGPDRDGHEGPRTGPQGRRGGRPGLARRATSPAKKDTLARIVRISPRTSVLRRTADDDDPFERVVVANADQLAIVTALADPEPRPRMIDRCLVAAYDGGLTPLLVLTKSDLASADKLLEAYTPLGVPYVVTSREEFTDGRRGRPGARAARTAGSPRSSGTPGSARRRWSTRWSRRTGGGRPGTSTPSRGAAGTPPRRRSRCRCRTAGGWVVDTPGVRSFGLHHVDPSRVILAFPDLVPGTEGCPRAAATTSRTARWTPGWRRGTPIRRGSTRCAGSSRPVSGARATDRPSAVFAPGAAAR